MQLVHHIVSLSGQTQPP